VEKLNRIHTSIVREISGDLNDAIRRNELYASRLRFNSVVFGNTGSFRVFDIVTERLIVEMVTVCDFRAEHVIVSSNISEEPVKIDDSTAPELPEFIDITCAFILGWKPD
jgi:hypothetical protein